jgi:hypothetical protein
MTFAPRTALPIALLWPLALGMIGCAKRESTLESLVPADPVARSSVPALSRPVLFQPMFIWEEGEPSYQGTGFFARTPDSRIAAVSSAHFLDRDGPPLLEARWLQLPAYQPLATFTQSWGQPGTAGEGMDLRSDYLLMPAPETIPVDLALDLDPRTQPQVNERIWFLNKSDTEELGYELLQGRVVQSDEKYSVVTLDQQIALQSQSGSPFISQSTGKVIGTLSSAEMSGATVRLLLTPSKAILDALAAGREFPQLRDVIGTAHRLGHGTGSR